MRSHAQLGRFLQIKQNRRTEVVQADRHPQEVAGRTRLPCGLWTDHGGVSDAKQVGDPDVLAGADLVFPRNAQPQWSERPRDGLKDGDRRLINSCDLDRLSMIIFLQPGVADLGFRAVDHDPHCDI